MAQSIIKKFYTAFENKDAATMAGLYADSSTFQDPAFGLLSAREARAMWTMLLSSNKSELTMNFEIIKENETSGEAIWHAHYIFGEDRRPVHNVVRAKFEFDNGKITKHVDKFNFWKWSRMALGLPGLLFGWSPILKNKVRVQVLRRLTEFMQEK